MLLTALGVNHQTAPLAVRERIALPIAEQAQTLGALRTLPGIEGAMILSTCWPCMVSMSLSIANFSVSGFASSGVISLNETPGFGKSGTMRMAASSKAWLGGSVGIRENG